MQPKVLPSADRSWAEGAPQRAEGGALSTAASWLAANKDEGCKEPRMRGGTRRRAAGGGQSRGKRRARRSSVAAGPSATAGRSPNFSGALRDSPLEGVGRDIFGSGAGEGLPQTKEHHDALNAYEKVVRAVGLEPTLLAELDFESSASTSFTTPAGEGDPFIKPPPRTPEGEAPMTGESQNGDIPGRDLAVSEAAAARSGRSHRVSPTGPLIRRDKRRSIVRDDA